MHLTMLAALVTSACATSTAVREEPQPAAAGSFHTMQPGETVWDLSRQSGLSVEEIVEVNGLPSADEVAAGQIVFLPAGASPVVDAPAPAEREEPTLPVPDDPTPLVWPCDGVVLRDFSTGKQPYDGLLIAAPAGTPVRAAAAGEVIYVGDAGTGYGLLVIVRHGDGDDALTTVYGHLDEALVKQGARVNPGQRIGTVGTSGRQESPRLHFQVRRGRTPTDPLPLLPPE
jgi:LysM repeat protein